MIPFPPGWFNGKNRSIQSVIRAVRCQAGRLTFAAQRCFVYYNVRTHGETDMSQTASSNINIRVSQRTRALIDKAAKALGRNRSEFVLDVAAERAQEVLLDRTNFELTASDHKRFVAALDRPLPKESAAALKRLLERQAPWEK